MDIRPLKLRFWIAATLLLVTALACASQTRNRRLLEQTQEGLLRAKAGLTRVREARATRANDLSALKAQYSQSAAGSSAERLLYGRVDELKARFRPDDLTISPIERKGGELSLQYSLRFINPNYDDFLNAVAYLDGAVFPLTLVSAVAITQADAGGRGVVTCTVSGQLLTGAKATP